MALPRDCTGCSVGKHDQHSATEGSTPGLIGGSICECTGDCVDRWQNLRNAFAFLLSHLYDVPVDMISPEAAESLAERSPELLALPRNPVVRLASPE